MKVIELIYYLIICECLKSFRFKKFAVSKLLKIQSYNEFIVA